MRISNNPPEWLVLPNYTNSELAVVVNFTPNHYRYQCVVRNKYSNKSEPLMSWTSTRLYRSYKTLG